MSATIYFGTNNNPGPVVNCSEDLKEIRGILDEGFKDGHWLALVETDSGFRLIVDRPLIKGGIIKLRPPQR